MGWTEINDYPQLSRADMVRRELTQTPTEHNPAAWGFHYTAERGAQVYCIMFHDAPGKPRTYFGAVVLTSRRHTRSGPVFGYKEITEDAGPYYYNAPARMLDMLDELAPNPPGMSAQWREKCRQHNARAKARQDWKPGDRIEYNGQTYTLATPAGRARGWIVVHAGHTYRMPARTLKNAQRLEPTA